MVSWFQNLPDYAILFSSHILAVLILLKTPIIGKYLSVTNTLVHEVSHAIMAILTGGKVDKLELFANTEGAAHHRSRYRIGKILTSFAGYPASSLTAILFIQMLIAGKYTHVLISMFLLLTISLIFWIRNIYGVIWIVSFISLFIGLLWLDQEIINKHVVFFITAIIYIESIRTAFTILLLSWLKPHDAGDAKNLSDSTIIIPAQIWGLLFFAISIAAGYYGITLLIKPYMQ